MSTPQESPTDTIDNLIIKLGATTMVAKWAGTFPRDRFPVIKGVPYLMVTPDDLIDLVAMVMQSTMGSRKERNEENDAN